MSPEQLRIRPENGTVRELNIPKDKLEYLEKVASSPDKTEQYKKLQIKKHAKISPCCVCTGIPAFEISFPFSEGGQQGLNIIAIVVLLGCIRESLSYSHSFIISWSIEG